MKAMIDAMASQLRKQMGLHKTLGARRVEDCPRCGAEITPPRLSFREIVLSAACGGLLLSILIPSC